MRLFRGRGFLIAAGAVLGALLLAWSEHGYTQSARRYWDISSTPADGPPTVPLPYEDADAARQPALEVRRSQVVMLQSVLRHVAAAANVATPKLLLFDHEFGIAEARIDESGVPAIAIAVRPLQLLRDDEDAIAFLMSHELSHLVLKHRYDVDNAFMRRQELEADALGIRIAQRAGYDPAGVLRWLDSLWHVGRTMSSPLQFRDTQPPIERRIVIAQRVVAQVKRETGASTGGQLWALIGLDVEEGGDGRGLIVRRRAPGSAGSLIVGDEIVAIDEPFHKKVAQITDLLWTIVPGEPKYSFRFSVIRRDIGTLSADFHSRKKR